MKKNSIVSGTWGTCVWGIDENDKLHIGDGVAASVTEGSSPWEEYKDSILEVETFGPITTEEGASLAGLFMDCTNLVKATVKTLDTSKVADMHSMFENCEKLSELDLTGFRTENVTDMSRMFRGCKSLVNLDLSSFDTTGVSSMRNMFDKCIQLHSLIIGQNFSTEGDGSTDCGKLSIRETGKYKTARVINAGSPRITYYENYDAPGIIEKKVALGSNYTIEDVMFREPEQDYLFAGWNTKPDDTGTTYIPGQQLTAVNESLDLYAIWIGLPKIGMVQPMREISYGETLPFELPDIFSPHDDNVTGYLEVSSTGEEGTWQGIKNDAILPASYDGYLLRLCATNKVGKSFSNAVRVRIKKAGIDISRVHWVESPDMTYDGQLKRVWLEGLPEGVTPVYSDNEGISAGEHTATVQLEYDADNYSIPVKIRSHNWTINKAGFDMTSVHWNYNDPFVYDGEEKTIELVGVPEGIEVEYEDNVATDAGVMVATAFLKYDRENFERPADITPCSWEIKRAPIDNDTLVWQSYKGYVYDGEPKSVYIVNLDSSINVEYSDAEAIRAGKYLARANILGNYCSTGPLEYEWEIEKAPVDMSGVRWNYTGPFEFDKQPHEVTLDNVPDNVLVTYHNNISLRAGDFTAKATFSCIDNHNYTTPQDMTLKWSIEKIIADMSNVRWDYEGPFEYDGVTKEVKLVGLPSDIYVTYDNNTAINSGVFTAHATLKYDDNNYEAEQPVDCQWQINKAKYDTSTLRWDYTKPFTYDGTEHEVVLVNLPDGLNVEYGENRKVGAGKYVASAKLTPSDLVNYETPEINGCTWSISKYVLERGEIKWTEFEDFVYDGKDKTVEIISDVGDMINVSYVGNVEKNAGKYRAVAKFEAIDRDNYEAPADAVYDWSIRKGDFDMRQVVWDYKSAFTYDGTRKEVKLLNVPDELIVHYENASATETGGYTAIARFEVKDPDNHNQVQDMSIRWAIQKASYDMSEVKWQEEKNFCYDGKEKIVELVGLPEGLIPVYRENKAKNASEYLASVDFEYDDHNYEKPRFGNCRWRITKSDFSAGDARWDYEEPFVYDGTEKTVRVIDIPDGGYVEYGNIRATDAGTYIATAELLAEDTDNYNHSRLESLTWRIEKGEYDMSHVYWDYEKPFVFDGRAKRIVLKGLPEGVYPVYQGNIGTYAGQYEASVTFRIEDSNNYNMPSFDGCTWEIEKTDYDMSSAQWNYKSEFTYNGKMQEIVLKGLPDGVKALYDGNCATNVGVYKASAKLIPYDEDNYNAPVIDDCNWEIVKADYDMSKVCWDYKNPKPYNGREQGVALENLPVGVYASYTGNDGVDVGVYNARADLRVADSSNYNLPSFKGCTWEIVESDYILPELEWNYKKEGQFVYDGKKKTVKITNIPEGVTATYNANSGINAGDYITTVEFDVANKNYRTPGLITKHWSIEKAECDMSGVRWDYTDEFTFDGKQHAVRLEGLPSIVSAEYSDNVKVETGTYTAVATFITDEDNYVIPEPMTCTWKINKATIDISTIRWDYDRSFTYDGEQKQVLLAGVPGQLNVDYTNNKEANVGQYSAHAELIPIDEKNYNRPFINDCEWEIAKSNYDMSNVRWVNDGPFTFDGDEHEVHLEGLPKGIVPIYTNNTGYEGGSYEATATFSYDSTNYYEPKIQRCKWRILKASYDLTRTAWSYKNEFVYDGNEKTIVLTGLPDGLHPIYSSNSATEAGSYVATVDFEYDDTNFKKPKFENCRWTIEKGDIPIDEKLIRWTYGSAFVYDGTPKTVALAEKRQSSGLFDKLMGRNTAKNLILGVPEGVEAVYDDNVQTDAGIYYATVTLRHTTNKNYKEYVVPGCRWEIVKRDIDMSHVRWSYENSFVYDGAVKRVVLLNVPDEIEVTYENNEATYPGSYEAQAFFKLKDEENYAIPKPINGCWWQIDKARYDMSGVSWTYDNDVVYNGKEKTVRLIGLPEGVKVETYHGNKAVEAGSYTADVVLKYKNPECYEEPDFPALRWKVQKKIIDTSAIKWNYGKGSMLVYDGQLKEVRLIGVPKELEVTYINNSKINAGTYTARAKLAYDTKNYELSNPITDCIWTIEKAYLDTARVRWDYTEPFEYDSNERTVSLVNVPNQIEVRYRDNKASAIGTYTAKAYLTYNKTNYNDVLIDTTLEWEIKRRSEVVTSTSFEDSRDVYDLLDMEGVHVDNAHDTYTDEQDMAGKIERSTTEDNE